MLEELYPSLLLIILTVISHVRTTNYGWPHHRCARAQRDHLCQIQLPKLTSSLIEHTTNSAAMQKPPLELTHLHLEMLYDELGPMFPDSFMGGPGATLRLGLPFFWGIAFPGLPKLL